MKPVSILIPLLLSGAASGCDGTDPAPPDAVQGDPVTITISVDVAPVIVSVRDGLAGPGRAATMTTPTTFEVVVHGPYLVTVVCDDPSLNQPEVEQRARTPDDERNIMVFCDPRPLTRHAVTGRMLQAGRVQLGDGARGSTTDNWDFNMQVRPGTFDLMARTADRIVLRRAIAVTGPVAVTPQIDVLQEGTALADVAFTVTNATPTETLVASVHIDRPDTNPFGIYLGPIATAKAVPDSVLAATDTQSASMQATEGSGVRSLRRPFRVGGDTTYTLPERIGGLQWDRPDGDLSVSWTSVHPFDFFFVSARGTSMDGTNSVDHSLQLSSRFVAATGIMRATLDTAVAGYKPEWRIDFTRQHDRTLFVQRVENGVITTNTVSETITGGARVVTGPDLPLVRDRLAHP